MQEKKFNLTKKALILAILFLVFHLILSFLRGELSFMVPPLLTFIVDDLGANLGQGGLLQTTSTLCMGVGMIFASIVIDKIGGSKTLALSTMFMFISGLLGLTATTFTAMLFARVFAGLGNAFSFPAVVAIVAERFRDKKTPWHGQQRHPSDKLADADSDFLPDGAHFHGPGSELALPVHDVGY